MTDRSRQGILPPDPIPTTETESERLRVLKIVAQRLPDLATRQEIKMVGKGGTILNLADGLTRPSTDYDADTDKPVGKPTLMRMMTQLLRTIPGVRSPVASWNGRPSGPVRFEWQNATTGIAAKSFLNTTMRGASTIRPHAWRLTGPEIDDGTIRLVDGMQIYTTVELMRGKASAFMARAQGRDTYDVAWALSTRLEDVEPQTRTALDQFMTAGTTDEQWGNWREDYETDPIMLRANMDPVMETILECLEKDPVVRCGREPERGLGFWVNGPMNTVALVLAEQGDNAPHEPLFEVPRSAVGELARFLVDARADLSHHLGLRTDDIQREGTTGLARIITNGIADLERERMP